MMRLHGTIAMFRYWNMLRAGRPAPSRAEIDPTAIRKWLPDIFILEFDDDRSVQFRLAGTRLCSIFGKELRHTHFRDLWSFDDRVTVSALVEASLNQQATIVMDVRAGTGDGHEADFELLLLPLHAGPGLPRTIGLVTTEEQPFWLGSHPVMDLRLHGARLVDPDAIPILDIGARTPSLAPDMFEPADERGARRVRHLVVHDGGKSKDADD
ncbi:PAS domain-containing protein [Aliihoeflea sp. PC F10.4]